MGPPNEDNVDRARKGAAWKSAALITLVFLVARDINSYIISGGALIGIDYMYKHNNAIVSGMPMTEGSSPRGPGGPAEYPLPDDGS